MDRLRSFLQEGGYNRVGTNEAHNNSIPGGFPEEPVQQAPRTMFNTHSLGEAVHKVSAWINYLVIQPVIIVIVVLFQLLSKFINTLYLNPATNGNRDDTTDPIDKVNKFVRNLEDSLPPQMDALSHLPPFFQGSYTQALYMATQRGKFLFVYLTNPQNESASFIFNESIINREFVKIFKESDNQVIIWGGDLTNPEAYQLANSLNVTKFPFLGLLCLTRNTKMTPEGPQKEPSKISLIAKMQGGSTSNASTNGANLIKSKFISKMNKYEPELKLIRQELKDKYMTEVLKKQQEYNYLQSVHKDMMKKAERTNRAKMKEYLEFRAPEFANLSQPAPNCAKIALKFADSTRQTVYFPKDMLIEDIYIYIELSKRQMLSDEPPPSPRVSPQEAKLKFKDLQVNFKFKLSSPLPPRVDLLSKRREVIENVNLVYPNGLLLVEDE
ncbi:uncharacterized protein LODBEIA_P51810 [Lodderomyces beijingensis]|uniref:UBX domain-containing protein n=1 Tax=Lodderomyces beijingensis TaxID=1775926 RepID=A0ABP0ZUE7_9ASCO